MGIVSLGFRKPSGEDQSTTLFLGTNPIGDSGPIFQVSTHVVSVHECANNDTSTGQGCRPWHCTTQGSLYILIIYFMPFAINGRPLIFVHVENCQNICNFFLVYSPYLLLESQDKKTHIYKNRTRNCWRIMKSSIVLVALYRIYQSYLQEYILNNGAQTIVLGR